MQDDRIVNFDLPRKSDNVIIKVIGVGGGGSNAVNHMYRQGIHDVSFLVCNTDKQALENSPVPNRLQLGSEGLGAGNRPEVAAKAAEESLEQIDEMLNDGTKMVFITAGMGGGTGTGAAPIIAREAMKYDILTVGIVTIPFSFEGTKKIDQALDGLEKMQENVDALLVINNERLRELYQNDTWEEAFAKADDTLTIAAKSIAEIITVNGKWNMDFNDVKTALKHGGVAIMSTSYAEGEGRISKAIEEALSSPLLNNRDVYKSQKILVDIFSSNAPDGEPLRIEEMNEIHEFMSKFSKDVFTKYGVTFDPSLGKKVKLIILASGFGVKQIIDEFHEAKNEEEAERLEQRRNQFYHNDKDGKKPYYQIFRFKLQDIDNDDVIAEVASLPTYNRQQADISRIKAITRRSQSVQQVRSDRPEQPADSDMGRGNTIVFD